MSSKISLLTDNEKQNAIHICGCTEITQWTEKTGPGPDEYAILDNTTDIGALDTGEFTREGIEHLLDDEGFSGDMPKLGTCITTHPAWKG